MPESCAIYSTRRKAFSLAEIKELAPNAEAKLLAGTEEQPEKIGLKWENSKATLTRKPGEEVEEHLEGFKGFAWKMGGEKMSQKMFHLFSRLELVSEVWGTQADPEITPEIEGLLARLAGSTQGLAFRDSTVFSSEMKPYLSAEGFTEAELTYWPSALKRKEASMEKFEKAGIKVFDGLPPVVAEEEVHLRSPQEVALRAIALFHIAGIALPDGLSREDARKSLAKHPKALSPNETKFLANEEATEQETIQYAWRIEALAVLAWTLKILPELPKTDTLIEVPALAEAIRKVGFGPMLELEELRPTEEILDALDFVYRARWVTTEARRKKAAPPALLHPGVLLERHYAFNWLVRFEGDDWDDVKTPT